MNKRLKVDTATLPWESGVDVVQLLAPEFRANLGPAELVEDLFSKYRQKTLFHDEATTRRIDLIDVAPGYRDLTNAYHDSVEECLVLSGSLQLDGEGEFSAGDYFWRPPGWVHAAATDSGFGALLMFQGLDPFESSGLVTRVIQPDNLAGTNQLHPHDPKAARGPRGRIVRQPTNEVVPIPGTLWSSTRHGQLSRWALDRCEMRVLSENKLAGGQSLLLTMRRGLIVEPLAFDSAVDFFLIEGLVSLSDGPLLPTGFVHFPEDHREPLMEVLEDATVFLKSQGWMGLDVR